MLLRSIARRFESLAGESISQNPSKSLIEALGGSSSLAGVPVTEATAESLPAVFACDRVIREDVAKTPIKVMKRLKDGGREADTDHPVYGLLHDLANPAMTASEFKDTVQHYVNFWGNGFAEIVRNARNEPIALYPLESARMSVELNSLNQLVYRYTMADGRKKEWLFNAANPPILHIRQNAVAPSWWIGRGPIRVLRDALGVAIAQQRYQARHFGQGGHAQMQITGAAALDPVAAKTLRQDYEAITRGEENWHRPVVLPFGFEVKPMAMPHRDAQFVDQLRMTRSQIAGIFRVPAHKINDLEKATFSNIEHQAIEWVTDGLMPHFVRWQQAIARDLLNPKAFNTHYAVFVVDALVQGDFKTRNEGLAQMRQNGVINANEWRRLLDMNPIPASQGGDDYVMNGTMIPVNQDPAALIENNSGGRMAH